MVKANKPSLFWLMLFKLTVHFVTTQKPNTYWCQQKQPQLSQLSDKYFWTHQTGYETFDHGESHTPFTTQILTFAVLM